MTNLQTVSTSTWRRMIRVHWAWLFFVWWFLFVFPAWYGLSYTKLRELQQIWGADYDQQLRVMHPPVMAEMLRLSGALTKGQTLALQDADSTNLPPLAASPVIWRSLLQGNVQVVPSGEQADYYLTTHTDASSSTQKIWLKKNPAP